MTGFYYVYILLLSNKQLYTGFTCDLDRRIREHQSGRVASTSKRQPLKLIHAEAYRLESDGRRREAFLKTSQGRALLRKQIRDVLKSEGVIE